MNTLCTVNGNRNIEITDDTFFFIHQQFNIEKWLCFNEKSFKEKIIVTIILSFLLRLSGTNARAKFYPKTGLTPMRNCYYDRLKSPGGCYNQEMNENNGKQIGRDVHLLFNGTGQKLKNQFLLWQKKFNSVLLPISVVFMLIPYADQWWGRCCCT